MDTQSEFWNEMAESNNAQFSAPVDFDTFQKLYAATSNVLDYGCGVGRNTSALFDLGFNNIVGYDAADKMVADGLRRCPNLSLHHYSPPSLPIPEASIDVVLCCAVISCIEKSDDRVRAIQEITRVLKIGGGLHLIEPLRHDNKRYGQDGMTTTTNGGVIKHFINEEVEYLLSSFDITSKKEVAGKSTSGKPLNYYQLFARKLAT